MFGNKAVSRIFVPIFANIGRAPTRIFVNIREYIHELLFTRMVACTHVKVSVLFTRHVHGRARALPCPSSCCRSFEEELFLLLLPMPLLVRVLLSGRSRWHGTSSDAARPGSRHMRRPRAHPARRKERLHDEGASLCAL
eukprot:7182881-Prymnesium_polylepis.2